jgi:hypothetical protein
LQVYATAGDAGGRRYDAADRAVERACRMASPMMPRIAKSQKVPDVEPVPLNCLAPREYAISQKILAIGTISGHAVGMRFEIVLFISFLVLTFHTSV